MHGTAALGRRFFFLEKQLPRILRKNPVETARLSISHLTAGDIAARVAGDVVGDSSVLVAGLGSIESAGPGDLVFISSEKYAPLWAESGANIALVALKLIPRLPPKKDGVLIAVADADVAFAAVLKMCEPPAPTTGLPESGVHRTAVVDPSAEIGEGARIGAHCVVGHRAVVGPRTVLYPGASVFEGARTGADCVLWNGVVLRERCEIGDRCVLHANVVIGTDGFGFRPAPDGKSVVKIPHIGGVRIGNDVEIGANTCVDRGKLSSTVIGDFCKIDNLCQIGHNSRLGRGVIICGKVGVSGSVTVGDGVMIGGGAGVADHVTIGAGASIAAAAGVMRDVPPGVKVSGIPARDIRQFFREQAALARLPEMLRAAPRMVAASQAPGVAPPIRK